MIIQEFIEFLQFNDRLLYGYRKSREENDVLEPEPVAWF